MKLHVKEISPLTRNKVVQWIQLFWIEVVGVIICNHLHVERRSFNRDNLCLFFCPRNVFTTVVVRVYVCACDLEFAVKYQETHLDSL